MARYTSIYSSIWDNPRIQDLLDAGELSTVLLYFYLLTNSSTNIIGFYQLSLRSAAAILCTTPGEIRTRLCALEQSRLLLFDDNTSNLLLLDFFAHNSYPSGEKQLKGMSNQLKQLKSSALDAKFIAEICKYADNDADEILKMLPNRMQGLNDRDPTL